MERKHAYLASDGSLHLNARLWVEHEFYVMLMSCTMNADKEMAAELVDRFSEFEVVYNDFRSDVLYGEGKRLELPLDRRILVKDHGPKVDTTVIPPDPDLVEAKNAEIDYRGHSDIDTTVIPPETPPDPEWRNKSRDHPSEAPLDQPVGVGTGMKLGGALNDVAF